MKGVIRSSSISYLLCTILMYTGSVEIRVGQRMQTGQSSSITCEVGVRTGGITFFTRPANVKGSCLGLSGPCSSSINGYSMDHNSSTVVLKIASVNCSRETGAWYCQHDGTDSNSDEWLNCTNILSPNGNLSYNGLRDDINTANREKQELKMVISCSNPAPVNITWQYKSNMQATLKDIPQSAVSVMSQETYDGTTCNPGEMFTISTMTASYTDDEFCGKENVIFSVKYYDLTEESVDPVSFDGPVDITALLVVIILFTVVEVVLIIIYICTAAGTSQIFRWVLFGFGICIIACGIAFFIVILTEACRPLIPMAVVVLVFSVVGALAGGGGIIVSWRKKSGGWYTCQDGCCPDTSKREDVPLTEETAEALTSSAGNSSSQKPPKQDPESGQSNLPPLKKVPSKDKKVSGVASISSVETEVVEKQNSTIQETQSPKKKKKKKKNLKKKQQQSDDGDITPVDTDGEARIGK